jgi:hypothetical protein
VRPCIGVQDMPEAEMEDFRRSVDSLPWAPDCAPLLRFYRATPDRPDLRTVMLNEMLQAVGSGYAAFLDYDDVMFPDAYERLLGRLKQTGRNATFGRVFSAMTDPARGTVLRRARVYEYGSGYADFLENNHAPIHSFMLDLDRIDLTRITYFPDMRFMEDYYLTLQIFTADDTDWASLSRPVYVGDYIHMMTGGTNTLAILDAEQRHKLLESPEYRLCEARIVALRRKLRRGPVAVEQPAPA